MFEKTAVWKVTIKERAMQHTITSELHGPYNREDVIKHYGLDEPDVEWYKIEEIDYGKERKDL